MFTAPGGSATTHLYQYIADAASLRIAANYVDRIVKYCEGLRILPNQGLRRDEIRPGLRITNYRKRAAIAFAVDEDRVIIVGISTAAGTTRPFSRRPKMTLSNRHTPASVRRTYCSIPPFS